MYRKPMAGQHTSGADRFNDAGCVRRGFPARASTYQAIRRTTMSAVRFVVGCLLERG